MEATIAMTETHEKHGGQSRAGNKGRQGIAAREYFFI
jgi:hypothetical protein